MQERERIRIWFSRLWWLCSCGPCPAALRGPALGSVRIRTLTGTEGALKRAGSTDGEKLRTIEELPEWCHPAGLAGLASPRVCTRRVWVSAAATSRVSIKGAPAPALCAR